MRGCLQGSDELPVSHPPRHLPWLSRPQTGGSIKLKPDATIRKWTFWLSVVVVQVTAFMGLPEPTGNLVSCIGISCQFGPDRANSTHASSIFGRYTSEKRITLIKGAEMEGHMGWKNGCLLLGKT